MTKGKKKQLKTLILLIIAVIIVLIAYILVLNRGGKEIPEEEVTVATEENLISYTNEEIKSISIINEYGEMSFIIDDEDVIRYEKDMDLPVNQTYGTNMFMGMSSLTFTTNLGKVEQLSDFGLENPGIRVALTLQDNTKKVIAFGDVVPLTGGHYITVDGDKNVYIVNDTFYNYYNYSLVEMTTVESVDSIASDYITNLKIERKDGEDFEIVYDENNPSDFANLNYWTVKAPYEISLPGNMEGITKLLGNYTSYTFLSCVDYNAKDLSIYGLDDPSLVYIKYYELYTKAQESTTEDTTMEDASTDTETEEETTKIFHEFELLIGNQDDEGNYYVKQKGSKAVNLMSGSEVDKLLNVDNFSTVNTFINLVNITDISSVDITLKDKKYTLSSENHSDTDNIEEETTSIYYVNGNKIDETVFKDFYQKLIGTTIEREIPYEDNNVNYDKTVMTVTYHLLSGKDPITIKYKEYDDNYYIVNVNGYELFLTDLRIVNEIVISLKELVK